MTTIRFSEDLTDELNAVGLYDEFYFFTEWTQQEVASCQAKLNGVHQKIINYLMHAGKGPIPSESQYISETDWTSILWNDSLNEYGLDHFDDSYCEDLLNFGSLATEGADIELLKLQREAIRLQAELTYKVVTKFADLMREALSRDSDFTFKCGLAYTDELLNLPLKPVMDKIYVAISISEGDFITCLPPKKDKHTKK